MDKLTTINLTYDKLLITVLSPGLFASSPYLYLIHKSFTNIFPFFCDHGLLSVLVALILLISLFIGFVIENLGSRIEYFVYDRINGSDTQVWNTFLKLTYDKEPVGHRYLRNILMRMKFELSYSVALVIMSVGLFCCQEKYSLVSQCNALIFFVIIPLGLASYLFYEGRSSSKILADTRKLLVDEFYKKSSSPESSELPS